MTPLISQASETYSVTSAGKATSPGVNLFVSEGDARAMVQLVGQVAPFNTEHSTAKCHLMDGVLKMVGADCWDWALAYIHPGKPPAYVSIFHGGSTEVRFPQLHSDSDRPDMKMLVALFAQELMTRCIHAAGLRQQVDPSEMFFSDFAYPLSEEAGIAPVILSAQPLNEGCVSLVGLYRRANQTLFNEREVRIAQMILTEVSWMHATGWPQDCGSHVSALSPSRKLVLNLLLEGHSRKIVADHLNLSIHTVNGYIKDIYRTFGVQSHAELMHRFARGVCNERPAACRVNKPNLNFPESGAHGANLRRNNASRLGSKALPKVLGQ